MAHLRVSSHGIGGESLVLEGERVVIGRSHACELVLPDVQLSRRHAEIVRTPTGWELRDLASLNGTWLNGARLRQPHALRAGDVVGLSEWQLQYHEGPAPTGTRVIPGPTARLHDVTLLATRSDVDVTALRRQNRILAVLTRAADSLVSTTTLDALVDTLLTHLREALSARRATVTLFDGPTGASATARTTDGNEPAAVDAALAERARGLRAAFLVPKAEGRAGGPHLCAPLWSSGGRAGADQLAGFVTVEAASGSRAFVAEDLQLASAIANLASGRLDGLRLREEAAAKRWLEEDVRGAARIQASLLPEENPSLEGWELAGSTRLCSAVGADYYDFALHPSGLLLALGDVAGKGLAAALLMAALRASVRALWREPATLSEIVGRINHGLRDAVPENRYATLFLAQLDPASGRLLWVNAGHAPPLLMKRGGEHAALEATGTILGPFPTPAWQARETWIEPGDVLVLCSDGIFEATRATSGPLTPAQLAEVVRAGRGGGASATLAALQAAADARLGGERQADDHTFVVLERLPPSGGGIDETPPRYPRRRAGTSPAAERGDAMDAFRVAGLVVLNGTLAAGPLARPAFSESPGTLLGVTLEVDGTSAPLYPAPDGSGRFYVEARPGSRYSVDLTNRSGERLGVVLTVDGLNVVSGARDEGRGRMYVLDPWQSTSVRGWRTSLQEVRQFTFVDEQASYSARVGRANQKMGWIEIAVYRERASAAWRWRHLDGPSSPRPDDRGYGDESARGESDERESAANASADAQASKSASRDAAQAPSSAAAGASRSYPGTGWGRRTQDPVVLTSFDPEPGPSETLTLRYEYRPALIALGVLPRRAPYRDRLSERERGGGFAPSPRW